MFAPVSTIQNAVNFALSEFEDVLFMPTINVNVRADHYLTTNVFVAKHWGQPHRSLKPVEVQKVTRAVECMRSHEVAA